MIDPITAAAVGGAALALYGLKRVYDTPSRSYNRELTTAEPRALGFAVCRLSRARC